MYNIELTDTEKKFISQYASDCETGNHLLCPRSDEYKDFCKEFTDILVAPKKSLNNHYKVMIEYFKQCRDYDYYMNAKEKLF